MKNLIANENSSHGGKRTGAGRKRVHPETPAIEDKGFATRVLDRIGQDGWRKYTSLDMVKSAEDYILYLLNAGDMRLCSENINKLLDRKLGKPAQSVIHADTRETAPDLNFGDLAMPASDKPGTPGKPN